jgi:agmatine deiminase
MIDLGRFMRRPIAGRPTSGGPNTARRMPAEWEPHASTWIAWPHHEPDWPGKLAAIPLVYAEIVRALAPHERVEILCATAAIEADAVRQLDAAGVDRRTYATHIAPTDRVWLRDSGPTGVVVDGRVELIRWRFNAWAKYDNYAADAEVALAIARLTGLPLIEAQRPDGKGPAVLEGGAIDVNGEGLLLATEECLLSTDRQVRNPGLDRDGYEALFRTCLGARETIWLGEGCAGDDTHGHVDDVARFVAPDVLVLAYEEDPADENHAASVDNRRRLELAGGDDGAFRIVTVPFPAPLHYEGQRLPASYVNFYVANGIVLVPTFNDVHDAEVIGTLRWLFPDRQVLGIHAVDLVLGLGTFHCLTQQMPRAQG